MSVSGGNSIGGQRELKAPLDDAAHGDVFVDLFPAQRGAGDTQSHRGQLLAARIVELAKPVGGEANLAPVGEFNENHPAGNPGANGAAVKFSGGSVHAISQEKDFLVLTYPLQAVPI